MRRVLAATVFAFLCSFAQPAAQLSAQIFSGLGVAEPGNDVLSLGVIYGTMTPKTRFRDGGGFDNGSLIGGSAAFWLNRYMGLQFSVAFSKHGTLNATDGGVSVVSGRDPSIQTYQGDLLGRYPLPAGAVTVSPYVGIGGGWKYFNWKWDSVGGRNSRGMDGAWSYVGGLEARFGAQKRFGLRGEYRDLRSSFARLGEDLTHKDRVFVGGLLLNF
jgi:hypothetical protein